ncbi:hypothetical protein ACFVWY_25210 [Streptomyces sp. NPDC058195]|uniref:hypothetical protein n=1 Tax=Streptomyces sp. NPDC058195 TaxID=3346375 RepID=UPI0036E78018
MGPSHEEARLLASGEKVIDILPALRAAPYGDEDIAVVFAHVDFGNRSITDYFPYEDTRTALACFALARPQNRPLSANHRENMNGGRRSRCGPAWSTPSSTRWATSA